MRKNSVKKYSIAACLLVTSLSATPALADWYFNQSEGYYKPQEYHNERFGNFPPADINQKIFSHLNTEEEAEENKSQTDNASVLSSSNQQVSNPAQNYSEQNFQQPEFQQPAYGSYNPGRNSTVPGKQRHKRNTGFSGPRNSSTSFSGPWNNRGSSVGGPWNNNGSSFSGPWNSNGSNFSGPWDNNGSNFSMPWGSNGPGNNRSGNNGSGFSPFGNGSGWSW